jgi:predicted nucleotidyltransferase
MDRPDCLQPTAVASLLGELRSSLEALYGDNLVGVRLFGSYARRQATPDSDVDVLLVLRELEDYGTEVGRVRDLLSRLSMQYGKTVAPVFVDANRFSAARLLAVPPEELAARYGIDLERPIAVSAGLPPDVLAAIEDAVARGVARGLREALGVRPDEQAGAAAGGSA